MPVKEITRDELENLYSHEGITRKELRYLLKINPNHLSNKLSEVFKTELNPFKHSHKNDVNLRGFIHAPPKKLLKLFNSIHYQLLSECGQYSLYILSSSPIDTNFAIPIIIPNRVVGKKKLSGAHFAAVSGDIKNVSGFDSIDQAAYFIEGNEVNLLGFDELFNLDKPILDIRDFLEMFKERFNSTTLFTNSIVTWFMSSPVYEGRAGGNALSPISPVDSQYKCDQAQLDMFQNELLKIPMPYFTKSKGIKSVFNYNEPIKTSISFFKSPEMNYQYEKDLKKANEFLTQRVPKKNHRDSELNLSTTSIELSTLKKRPFESFIKQPVINAEVLTNTDLPLIFTTEDFVIDDKDSELYDYSMELMQLVYHSKLRIPNSPFEPIDTFEVVKHLMDEIRGTFFELHELMVYNIVFKTGPIGGLGEHLTRIANSLLRAEPKISEQTALDKSEELFIEMINRLIDEFNRPIRDLYYEFEDARAERDQIKSYQLRNIVNSVMFELNNTYRDGWAYEVFESEITKREITEQTPGLYRQIIGFDRYF
jgi:hypothetical protein